MNGASIDGDDLRDPTIPFMTLDIANMVLELVDDLPALGAAITAQIREMTGAQVVALIRCGSCESHRHEVIHVQPARRLAATQAPAFQALVTGVHDNRNVVVWPEDGLPPVLAELGYSTGLAMPLNAGAAHVGVILALGLAPAACMVNLKPTLAVLAGTVGLAVQNSYLVQEQEGVIRQRTRQLRDSEAMVRAILNASSDIVLLLDQEGRILDMNTAVLKYLGLSRNEVLGSVVYHYFPPELAAERRRMCELALAEGEPVHFSDQAGDLCFENSIYPLRDGGSAKVVVFSRDVSKERAMEARSAELEDQLRQSEKMQALGQLAGGVAHDFNNLLSAIAGSADLLFIKSGEQERTKRCYDVIVRAVERAEDLTRQLTAFARKGRQESIRLDVHQSIRQVIGILKHTIDRRIRINQHLHAEPSHTIGDPTLLHNALLNLAVNARDAMPEGGELTFETAVTVLGPDFCIGKPDLEPGTFIRILVSDTGCGIPEELVGRIFEPFFTTKPEGKGTGLGLANVFGAIASHHGWIGADSEVGHGTTFNIHIPLIDADDRAAHVDDAQPGLIQGTGFVLVVDDEEDIRENAVEHLVTLGYEAHGCYDGAHALEYFSEHHEEIDLVVMDMVMPRMNGRDAFARMQEIDPRVRVLFATGFAEKESLDDVLRNGAIGLLRKPFRVHELAEAVAEAMT